jgi:hypothetical protein
MEQLLSSPDVSSSCMVLTYLIKIDSDTYVHSKSKSYYFKHGKNKIKRKMSIPFAIQGKKQKGK